MQHDSMQDHFFLAGGARIWQHFLADIP